MKLDRPTHVRKSNRSTGWMTDFTEEVPGQIAIGINRLGDGEYTYSSIHPLPVDAEYDEIIYYDTHSTPAGWSLREQPEFSDTAVAQRVESQAAAGEDKPTAGRAPVTKNGGTTATSQSAKTSNDRKPTN